MENVNDAIEEVKEEVFTEVVEAVSERTLEEQSEDVKAILTNINRYRKLMDVVMISDEGFQFESDRSTLNKVTNRTPCGHITVEIYDIISRGEGDMPSEIKWKGKATQTPENFKEGLDRADYYYNLYEKQLEDLVKKILDNDEVDENE